MIYTIIIYEHTCIIATSLAPSPMANVRGAGLMPRLTILTINAFCEGLT
jgi:hypothetical protein